VLVGLAGSLSDIDIIVYGYERSQRIRKVLAPPLLKEGNDFKAYVRRSCGSYTDQGMRKQAISFADMLGVRLE